MLTSTFLAAILAITAARLQNEGCRGDFCEEEANDESTSCSKNLLPWLCILGHRCCAEAALANTEMERNEGKRHCKATQSMCLKHGGTCVRAKKNDCATADVKDLCNGSKCTCCIGDNPFCSFRPICRLRGGYCFKRTPKLKAKELCPTRNTLKSGCSGNQCSCCYPDEKCQCGKALTSNRIVGGGIVKPRNKYPWMVGIQVPSYLEGFYVCGGAIINDRYILTAAHCLFSLNGTRRKPEEILVGVADHRQLSTGDDIDGVTALLPVKKLIAYKTYRRTRPNNDIGLLKLKNPLDLKAHKQIKPACLPTNARKKYTGSIGHIYGWGVTSTSGTPLVNVLREAKVPILGPNCEEKVIGFVGITPQMMCAGYEEGGKDTCLGDSGGPLTVEEDGHHILVGITSFGSGCGDEGSPGVYTRVTAFIDWIIENTRDASYCS